MNKLLSFSFVIFFAAFMVSCSSCQDDKAEKGERKVKETITSGVIDISCDESFEPIMEQEIMVFEAAYPKVPFTWLATENEDAMVYLLRKDELP